MDACLCARTRPGSAARTRTPTASCAALPEGQRPSAQPKDSLDLSPRSPTTGPGRHWDSGSPARSSSSSSRSPEKSLRSWRCIHRQDSPDSKMRVRSRGRGTQTFSGRFITRPRSRECAPSRRSRRTPRCHWQYAYNSPIQSGTKPAALSRGASSRQTSGVSRSYG